MPKKIIVLIGLFILGGFVFLVVAQSIEEISAGREPIIPPLGPMISFRVFHDTTLSLDGLDCVNCTFHKVTFEYSGGAFKVQNSIISEPQFVLKGAAANTAMLLALLDSVGSKSKAEPVQPNKPVLKAPASKDKFNFNMASPYNGQQ
jgi:hypothetical protein